MGDRVCEVKANRIAHSRSERLREMERPRPLSKRCLQVTSTESGVKAALKAESLAAEGGSVLKIEVDVR